MSTTGRNALHGSIPNFFEEHNATQKECESFPSPFKKINLGWVKRRISPDVESLVDIRTLSLSKFFAVLRIRSHEQVSLTKFVNYLKRNPAVENNLSGPFPVEFTRFINLFDLSLGKQGQKLRGCAIVLILFVNSSSILLEASNNFTGTIPTEVANLKKLAVLDLRKYIHQFFKYLFIFCSCKFV